MVDTVICTKDRPELLRKSVQQANEFIPCNRIIVVDSSENPNKELLENLQVKWILTPNATLGYARQQGLLAASSTYVVSVDDDIILEKGWYRKMRATIEKADSKVLAVSSRIIFGYETDKIIEKMCAKANRGEGGSIGIALLKRQPILELGGFNPAVHRGEDLELHLRMKKHGYKWIRSRDAVAYHPCTLKQYLKRARNNGFGYVLLWRTLRCRFRFITERYGAALLMPIYYALLTLDMRVLVYYFASKMITLLTFLWEVNKTERT